MVDNIVGIDDILFGFGHFFDATCDRRGTAVDDGPDVTFTTHLIRAQPCSIGILIGLVRHHALRKQRGKRLFHVDHADMAERTRPETGVEQMQNRVLDTANILVNRQPFFRSRTVKGLVMRLACKADEVPAGIDKRIERVGFAARLLMTFGAVDLAPGRVTIERVAGDVKADVFGQFYRQLVIRHGDRATCLTMDDRDWRAPITLARNAPVAQAILRLALAPAFFLGLCDHISLRLIDGHPVHPVRIHDEAGVGVGDISFKMAVGQIAIGHDAGNGQMIFAREIKVALVMCRAAKDRARAVIHQDEIGDINGQVPAWIQRVLNGKPRIEAKLFSGFNVGRCRSAFAAFRDKVLQIRRVGRQLLRDRVVCGNGNKACAEHGVGARCKHINAVVPARKAEPAFQTLRFANPVFLHQPHLVGPLVKRPKANEQFFGKVGNFQKPLAQLAALNRCT